MIRETIVAILIAFVISAVLCPVMIPFLRRLKFGQQVRNDGPQAHLKKSGTPTMGGIVFLISVLCTSVFYIKDFPDIVPILFAMVGFGIVGFLDDYLKIVMKRSEGLNPKQKLLGQLIVSGILCYYFVEIAQGGRTMLLPFAKASVTLPWYLFVPFFMFALLATDNGVNLTDGLDGLCSSVTVLVATFFTVVALGEGSRISPVTGAVAGSLLGFLLFNVYPAKVFMGDTGSLALGGFVAITAFSLGMPLIILLVGLIYVVEVCSVVLQVSYFKATKGKRLFKMAPIHHHFELCGWSETRIVAAFSIVTALLCLVAYLGI
ncbi:MAG: phospho-N-acetylmuramoyl-pentapeptide-transferase [Lachnospiraceae bacterium]|nr:phospho-N-acetylmuramoyl-pentapeptide-transferase [Lachnospiraceae bacterium]